jgi:hypothetical protein
VNIECIIRQYFATQERMNEVIARTNGDWNNPERVDAIMRAAQAAVAIDTLKLSKYVGRTFWNSWD